MRCRYSHIVVAALTSTLLAAAPAPSTGPAKLPFTISKETTAITEPLHPDGTPDYLAALNEKYGKGVTPDNNALIPLLQIRGSQAILPYSTDFSPDDNAHLMARFLELAGAQPTPSDAPVFQTLADYARTQNLPLTPNAASTRLIDALQQLWTAKDAPDLAAYIHSQDRFLDLAVEASNRPRLYFPFVSLDGHFPNSADISTSGWSAFGRTWAARAMLRASSGDVDGALRDIAAMKRLSRLLTTDGLTESVLLGRTFDYSVNQVSGVIAASGKLTKPQCDLLAKALDVPPIPVLMPAEPGSRWRFLDEALLIAMGHKEQTLRPGADLQTLALVQSIDASAVDWDSALRAFNAQLDHDQASLAAMSFAELTRQSDAYTDSDREREWRLRQALNLDKQPNESRANYTKRFLDSLTVSYNYVNYYQFERSRRISNLLSAMLPTLLAAARVHAQSGQWPKSLQDLPPAAQGGIPVDPYSPTGASVRYRIIKGRASVYSIGRDHTADTADDVCVGEPSIPSTPGLP